MTVAEQLQAMERLWEVLGRDGDRIASPEWHGQILMDRKARAERGEAKFLTLEQLRARLQDSQS